MEHMQTLSKQKFADLAGEENGGGKKKIRILALACTPAQRPKLSSCSSGTVGKAESYGDRVR